MNVGLLIGIVIIVLGLVAGVLAIRRRR